LEGLRHCNCCFAVNFPINNKVKERRVGAKSSFFFFAPSSKRSSFSEQKKKTEKMALLLSLNSALVVVEQWKMPCSTTSKRLD